MAKKAAMIGSGVDAAASPKMAKGVAAPVATPARMPPNKTAPAKRNPIGNLGKWAHPSGKGKKK
jgi:hypothetical protein